MNDALTCEPDSRTAMSPRRRVRAMALATGVLLICFCRPLVDLTWFAFHSALFSYILLIPFISGYLIWGDRKALRIDSKPGYAGAGITAFVGAAALVAFAFAGRMGWSLGNQDYLSLTVFSFLCLFWSLCMIFLGTNLIRQIAFSLAFLIFIVPIPSEWVDGIDIFFQHASAAAAAGFFHLAGTAVDREELILHLPGAPALRVAPECSGIHSTIVLFITALLAGYLFLKNLKFRSALTAAVIPLAILRNGFRIFVIGELCIHVGPEMIHSPIHHKGGPIFFALSLIPFFLMLVWLRKMESNRHGNVKHESS